MEGAPGSLPPPAALPPAWRATYGFLMGLLLAQPGLLALGLAGSGAGHDAPDLWSDLDVIIVAGEGHLPSLLAGDWLAALGPVYALDRSTAPGHGTLRLCLADLRRLDLIVVTEHALQDPARAPGALAGCRVLHDPSGLLERCARAVAREGAGPDGAEAAFRQLDAGLRWDATLAVVKVGGGDLLIGAHLALAVARRTLVLGMLLRDRAAGTTHHRRPLPQTPALTLPAHLTADGILDLIGDAVARWEGLARQWAPDDTRADHRPLLRLIAQARPAREATF